MSTEKIVITDEEKQDKDKVKAIYMASQAIEWSTFCEAVGWNTQTTRLKYPVPNWVREKKKELAEKRAEEISESAFTNNHRFKKDVQQTMRDYPASIDLFHQIVRRRLNEWAEIIREDDQAINEFKHKLKNARPGEIIQAPKRKYDEIKTSELNGMGMTLFTIQQAKYKSLLLDKIIFKEANQVRDDYEEEIEAKEKDWTFQIRTEEGLLESFTGRQLEEWMEKYMDKPRFPEPEEKKEDGTT